MANKLVTAKVMANLMIKAQEKETVFPMLVNSSFNADFQNKKSGGTIYIPKVTKFEAKDFNGTQIEIQDLNEGEVALSLNIFKDVSFTLTAKERTVSTKQDRIDFRDHFVIPAMDALNAAMEQEIADQALTVSQYVKGLSGGVPSSMKDLAKIKSAMSKGGIPKQGRKSVVGTDTAAEMIGSIPQLTDKSASGESQGVIEASIGRKSGIDFYESAYMWENEKEASTATGGAVSLAVSEFDGEATINLDGLTDATVFKPGTIITFTGGAQAAIKDEQVVSGTTHALVCWNLTADVAEDATYTFVEMGSGIAFGSDAIAFASVPLQIEDDNGTVVRSDKNPALYIRATEQYNIDKKATIFSFDFLAGTKVIDKKKIWRIGGL